MRKSNGKQRYREGHDVHSVRKNSGFDFVLKGRGFSRAVSATKLVQVLAAEFAAESIRLSSLLKRPPLTSFRKARLQVCA
jgi:hypothetical protein